MVKKNARSRFFAAALSDNKNAVLHYTTKKIYAMLLRFLEIF